MKRLLLAFVVLGAALTATVATAQVTDHNGFKLAFTDCAGASTATWTCTSNSGNAMIAVASVEVSAALTTLTGEESSMELVFQTAVPEWWKAGTGFCRAGTAIAINYSVALGGSGCVDYFGSVGSGPSGGYFLTIGPGSDALDAVYGSVDANRVRIRTVSAVDGALAEATPPPAIGDEVFVFNLAVNKTKTVGTGACAGCDQPVCILLKHVLFTQSVGIGDHNYINPATGSTGVIVAQNVSLDCVGVPSRAKSWGQIKSLYR